MTMHRQKSHIPLIDSAANVAAVGQQVVTCFDPLARFLDVAYRLDSSLNTLSGKLTIKGGADPDPATHSIITTGTEYNDVSGVTITAGEVVFTTAATPSVWGLIRIPDPPPYVSLAYAYTSGGGTSRLRAKAIY